MKRRTITKVLVSLIISIVIFYPFNPRYIMYMFVIGGVWGILLFNYQVKKNAHFFLSVIIFSITNLSALALTKLFIHHTLHEDWLNITVCISYLSALLVLSGICIYYVKKRVNYQADDMTLFNRRRYDLERIEKYIETEDILGINGIWGSGKTFLINQMKKRLNDSGKYIFIDVDLLSCNLDELQTILLNEMERVLYEHKIVSTHSTKLKRMLHENVIYRYVYMLLMHDDMSYSEALTGFIQEIGLLDETIVIVYEDIDRISNVDTVKKIFSISERLASKHIKIIYQYEETNLSKLGLDREYLEKYIPFVVNLTPIGFMEILESVFQDEAIDKKVLKVEDFRYLTLPIHTNYYFEKALGMSHTASIRMDYVAIRKVRNFVRELAIILNEKELYNKKEYKHTVINFYFIKHFFTPLYNQFNIGEGLLETIKFEYEGRQCTLLELIAMEKLHKENNGEAGLSPEHLKALFDMADNKEKLFILDLFEYDLEVEDIEKDFREIVNEPVQNLSKKASNEKKDRLIWNLLCNGKSEYTDYETAANKFIENVLSKPKDEQRKQYNIFLEEMYHQKHEKKDNRTIFRIGIPQFISLAQALGVSNIAGKDWKQFISFYFEYTKKDEIDIELIQILNYCSLDSREVYLDILKSFNSLKIVGNMNIDKSYKHFLKKYLRALSSLGYANTSELWMLDVPEKAALEPSKVKLAMEYIEKDICKMRDKIVIEIIRVELDTIMAFMNKNMEIVKSEKLLKIREPRIHTEMSSKFVHQEEFDRLIGLRQTVDEEHFMEELEASYKNECISAHEVDRLLEQNFSERR